MQDIFSKACLAVIAVSLATIAYVQVNDRQTPSVPQSAASPTDASKDKRCIQALNEARITLSTLEAQIKNVPATVEEEVKPHPNDKEPRPLAAVVPNRLYEQLMLQIIQTKTEIEALTAKCGS